MNAPFALLPTAADVDDAARRLAGVAIRTPLVESELLNAELGFRLLVKAEVLQRTGSFKFRGAYNTVSRIPEADKARGVLAYSSGNHAQGVALAARLCGVPATIIMPTDAPRMKIDNTRAYGAEVVFYDRPGGEDREAIGAEIAARTGATLVKPYDNFHVIAGQGTCGLEIADECNARGIAPDAVIVCSGGGGLTAGVALAIEGRLPGAAIYAAEPAGWDDWRLSLAAGDRVKPPGGPTICDAIVTPMPGELTFPILKDRLAGALTVTDDEVRHAMRLAFAHLKLVVEPGGAAAMAAAVTGKLPGKAGTVVVTASGGNVDQELFAAVIAGA